MLSCANASDGRTTVASASRALSRARDDIARSVAQAGADCNRLRPVRAEIPSARRRFLLEATPTEGTGAMERAMTGDRKSTRLNSSHGYISYAVFCLKKKKTKQYT